MPRKLREPKTRRRKLSAAHVMHLCRGHIWLFYWPNAEPASDEELRQAWRELRGPIMRFWLKNFPRTRPWAWWEYESSEYRVCLNGTHPCDLPGTDYQMSFGEAHVPIRSPDQFVPEYETEERYLRRLHLLESGEATAVGVADDKRFDAIRQFAETWLGF